MIGTSEKNTHNMDEGLKVPNWILSQLVQEGLTFIIVFFIWGIGLKSSKEMAAKMALQAKLTMWGKHLHDSQLLWVNQILLLHQPYPAANFIEGDIACLELFI